MDRVTDSVWRLELRGVNAYLATHRETILIDAGTPWDSGRIRESLGEADYSLRDIDRVLITHYDMDHVGSLHDLTPELNATVHMMEPDRSYLTGSVKPPFRNHKGAFQRLTRFLVKSPGLDIQVIGDNEELAGFTTHHTPGHTPGHTAYVDGDTGVAFLGDLVMESDGKYSVPNRFLNYYTSLVRESIREFADGSLEFQTACVGHGEPVEGGASERLEELASML